MSNIPVIGNDRIIRRVVYRVPGPVFDLKPGGVTDVDRAVVVVPQIQIEVVGRVSVALDITIKLECALQEHHS